MGLPKPYYEHAGITIYNCDAREILPHLPKVDLVLTDPPYGIADIWSGGSAKHGWGKSNVGRDVRNTWDAERACPSIITNCRHIAKNTVIWGGNYFADVLPATRGWLVWNKPERGFSLAEAELAWTDKDMVVRVCDCNRSDYGREHPTQKPIKLMTGALASSLTPKPSLTLSWALVRHW